MLRPQPRKARSDHHEENKEQVHQPEDVLGYGRHQGEKRHIEGVRPQEEEGDTHRAGGPEELQEEARDLTAHKDDAKKKALLDKLVKLGLLKEGQGLDDVLALTINNILERRLQTLVWKKGLAKTPKMARQLITHGKVTVSQKLVKSPSYIVPTGEEGMISLRDGEKGVSA